MSPSSIIARELGVIVNLDKVDRMLATLRGVEIVTVQNSCFPNTCQDFRIYMKS